MDLKNTDANHNQDQASAQSDEAQSSSMQVNLKAKHLRHKRVFLRNVFFSKYLFRKSKRSTKVYLEAEPQVKDPFTHFVRQSIALACSLLIVTSIAPSSLLETGFTADYFGEEDSTDFFDVGEADSEEGAYVINEEGFLLKTSPITEDASRIGMTDSVSHTVASGETVSSIALIYGISVNTILWENNMAESSTLRVGQTLTIPSLDGINHMVVKGDSVASVAKKYEVDEKLVRLHNKIEGDTLVEGGKVYIPGGKKSAPVIVMRAGTRSEGRSSAGSGVAPKVFIATNAAPVEGSNCIFPTAGKITQNYRKGHWAIDIGNSSRPDVWAACGGTVIKVNTGCPAREVRRDFRCGGGYGNYVDVEHESGLVTRYAHLGTVYVLEGQQVDMGQGMGEMSNSGQVRGKTGIHLHWEARKNGSLINAMTLVRKN